MISDGVVWRIVSDSIPYINKYKHKENIDRRLHKNKQLALAIGLWLDETDKFIEVERDVFLLHVTVTGTKFILQDLTSKGSYTSNECTLPDNYNIPSQVLRVYTALKDAGRKVKHV